MSTQRGSYTPMLKSCGVEDTVPVRWRWVGGPSLFLRMLRGSLGSGRFLLPKGTTSPGAPPRLLLASSATWRAKSPPPPPRFRSSMSCILSAAAAATAWEGRGRAVGTSIGSLAADPEKAAKPARSGTSFLLNPSPPPEGPKSSMRSPLPGNFATLGFLPPPTASAGLFTATGTSSSMGRAARLGRGVRLGRGGAALGRGGAALGRGGAALGPGGATLGRGAAGSQKLTSVRTLLGATTAPAAGGGGGGRVDVEAWT